MSRRSGRVFCWAAIVVAHGRAYAPQFGRGTVTGPVRDRDRAMIVGSRTFGGTAPPRKAERRALTMLRGLPAALPTKDRG